MFIQQTIDEYIDNPMGKGSTAIANRNLIKNDLNQRYHKLITKYKDFKTKRFAINDDYYFHVLIPSETDRENTYDVVIKFVSLDNDIYTKDLNLKRYYMSIFSNCPSFVFTYTFVYDKFGMLIPELKDKYDEIVFKSNPVVKNPGEIINYDKSVYFACKYLQEHSTMLSKLTYPKVSQGTINKYFYKEIRSTSVIMREINKEKARLYEIKNKEKNIDKKYKDPKVLKRVEELKTMKSPKAPKAAKIKPKAKVKSTIDL